MRPPDRPYGPNPDDEPPRDIRDLPGDDADDDEYEQWELDEFEELNQSTAASTFIDHPWFRRAGIAFALLVLLAFGVPLLVPLFTDGGGNSADSGSRALPDFLLPSANAGNVRLSDEAESHSAVVIVFYRGYDCTACRDQLADFQGAYSDMRAQGAELLAISVDSAADARRMATHVEASFPVLYDENRSVLATYGLTEALSDGGFSSATFILDRNRNLTLDPVGSTPANRLPGETIVEVLRQLNGNAPGTSI